MLMASLVIAAPAGATSARPHTASVDTPCGAAPGTALYVTDIYHFLLDRCPDAGGLNYWTTRIDGGLSRPSFVLQLIYVDESLNRQLTTIYEQLLRRDPTTDDLAFWSAQVRARGWYAVNAAIAASDEVYDHLVDENSGDAHDADSDFIDFVYDSFLGRETDLGSHYFWLGYIEPGPTQTSTSATRTAMVASLLRSDEFSRYNIGFAYALFLGRLPDKAGAAYWVTYLSGGGSFFAFVANLLGSAECYSLSQTPLEAARRSPQDGGDAGLAPLAGPDGVAARARALGVS
jgi:hypothetical protein